MNKIELKNVSYVYGEKSPMRTEALKNIDLSIEEGRICGIIGHTGSGKSTLVRLLNGLEKPSEGEVLLDGKNIWEDPKKIKEIRFRVGLVFQYPEYQLFEETVYKDIAFGPKNMGLGDEEIDRRVRDSLIFTGLSIDVLDKSPFELSGGQKRRVAIAGVMAMEPEVIIFDEPAAGLDPMGREEILGGVRSFQREKKNTVIIVSHSMEDMARYADDIVVLNEGTVFMKNKCSEIFREAEKLTEVGLDIPQITRLFKRLHEKGIAVDPNVFTVEHAKSEITRLIEAKGRNKGC
ncbi:MAG: energy-coupling factor transporter ATPase [Ruminococcaceae bacterium]|nr:energy-coupling factor transporter ATPase [Oscillospiraceae bacterium]